MEEFYTKEMITSFAPLFCLLRNDGVEIESVRAVFHYGMFNTTLLSAVIDRRPNVVRFILEHHPPVLLETKNWMSTIAARGGCLEIVKMFPKCLRAFETAVFEGHVEIAEHLYEHEDVMELACQGGHIPMVDFLISKGQDVSDSAICAAAGSGHLLLTQKLVEDFFCPVSAIYRAVRCGQLEVTEMLLPRFREEINYLLVTAACTPYIEIVKLLVANGAVIESWLISMVRERGYRQNADYLEDIGPPPRVRFLARDPMPRLDPPRPVLPRI